MRKGQGVPVLVYDPTMDDEEFFGSEVTHDLEDFERRCDPWLPERELWTRAWARGVGGAPVQTLLGPDVTDSVCLRTKADASEGKCDWLCVTLHPSRRFNASFCLVRCSIAPNQTLQHRDVSVSVQRLQANLHVFVN